MNFTQRHPSGTWEAVPLAGAPHQTVWVWFKPANFPQGLLLRIPDEAWQNPATAQLLTMQNMLQSAGVDPETVSTWHLFGSSFERNAETSPLFDQPLPKPLPGSDPNIAFVIEDRSVAATPAAMTPDPALKAGGVPPDNTEALFERIEVDWQAIITLDAQMTTLRRQLADLLSRLSQLNRDLSPEERLHGERKDKSDWLIARRWLRDYVLRISRCIKEHDIGDATYAGRRAWFEDTYQQVVAQRQPVDDLEKTQREFEAYRKLVQSQFMNANAVHAAARQDGEQRARQILTRISASVRAARTKR